MTLPNLPEQMMPTIRPAILIADSAGSVLGYMRGGPRYAAATGKQRSLAQAGLVVPADGEYTILAALDGHQNPQQNPVFTADFTLTVIPAAPLAVNKPREATRPSAARDIYAFMIESGNFDVLYEELAETFPGTIAVDLYRLGSPVDAAGLQQSLVASTAANQTWPLRDNVSAERMGLEKLTYFVFVDSYTLPGEEPASYTSNYRLTISREGVAQAAPPTAVPAPAQTTAASGEEAAWEPRLNHTMRIQFNLPANWETAGGNNSAYSGPDGGSLTLSLENHFFAASVAAVSLPRRRKHGKDTAATVVLGYPLKFQ